MGDENPISTLGDYSKPSPRAIRIPSSSPKGTTWYLFDPTPSGWCKTDAHSTNFGFEDPNQHLKDFLKLMDSLDLDSENRERTRLLVPMTPRNCMENPEQAFVEYASSRTDEAGEGLVFEFMASRDARLSKFEVDFKQQQSKMTNKIDIVLKAITDRIAGTLLVTDISKMDKNKAKLDKSEHEIGRVCSWRGGPFNGRNYRCCTNVSFGDEFVCNPDPISNDETPDFGCGDPLEDGVRCQHGTCKWCGYNLRGGFCLFCTSREGNSSIDAPNLNSFNNPPDFSYQPPQHQPETYSYELSGNDSHYGYDCPPRFPLYPIDQSPPQEMSIQDMELQKQQYLEEMQSISNQIQIKDYRNKRIDIHYRRECEIKIDELKANFNKMSIEINKITKEKELQQREQAANLSTHTPEPSQCFNFICYDDEESIIPLNENISQIPSSIVITPVLPIMEPGDSLIEINRHDGECDLPFCDDFPPLDVLRGYFMTFSNPLFDSNDDFTSSDDESLPEEDVSKENFKIYSNPYFEFDDEYISSDVNSLFNEELEDIKNKDSYVSNFDDPALLITPLSDEDECFDPGGDIDEIDAFLDIDVSTDIEDGCYDSEGDIIYLESLHISDTIPNLPPKVFLDHDPKSLEDEPDKDDLKNIVKVFDPGIWEKNFSPTYVKLSFEDRHYLSLTYVIQIFLPYFTYPVNSSLPLSSRSEDTIFDPGIFAFHFSSLEPMASHRSGTFMCFNVYLKILNESPIEIYSSTCFVPNITMIWGESRLAQKQALRGWQPMIIPSNSIFDCLDFEGSRARGFVHRSLDLQSLACLYIGIRYPRSY
ncbi:hypothetical protein Tco_0369098 [Tanacetum coccineum]